MDKGDNVINKRTVYAIRALYELAQSQEYSSTTDAIAQARNISKKFLPQILSDLSRAGLVRTTRGFGGGVRLSRPPEKISILEIIPRAFFLFLLILRTLELVWLKRGAHVQGRGRR